MALQHRWLVLLPPSRKTWVCVAFWQWGVGVGMLTKPKIDAHGLQGGEGEQANPKGHEPVWEGSERENGQSAGRDALSPHLPV
jgi:hypothetical protein